GRKKSYATYLFIATALVPLYGMSRSPMWLLILGPPVAFFGTGFFSGYAAIAAALFVSAVLARLLPETKGKQLESAPSLRRDSLRMRISGCYPNVGLGIVYF